MRQFVSSLIIISEAFIALKTYAVTPLENNYCEAILYGTDFGSQPTLFGEEFNAFAKDHSDWRVAISWGKTKRFRMHMRMNEPVTDRVLPMVPVPQDPLGTQFSVATSFETEDGRSEFGQGLFRIVPMQEVGGHDVKYALTFKAESVDRPLSEADLITIYVALAAVPYASHLILEQRLSLSGIDLNEAQPMRTIREAKVAGRADGEAVNLVIPKLVRSLIAKGEPFKFIGRRHFAWTGEPGKDFPSTLLDANRVYIQYHFGFPSLMEAQKSQSRSLN